MGGLLKAPFSYRECLKGLDAVIASVMPQYESVGLVSWGANTWAALQGRVPNDGTYGAEIWRDTEFRDGRHIAFVPAHGAPEF